MLATVTNIDNSVWINASAGCGKTALLVKRLVSLLVQKQKNIICITFTKAAANEMYNRLFGVLTQINSKSEEELVLFLSEYLNYSGEIDYSYVKSLLYRCDDLLVINTFHSFCLNAIQGYDRKEVQEENFSLNLIIDEFIRKRCVFPTKISQMLTEYKLSEILSDLASNIHKNHDEVIQMLDSGFHEETAGQTKQILHFFDHISKVYRERNGSPLTFDSIIDEFIGKKMWNVFEVTSRIDHILVDEAQDTNLKQWYIIAKLCEEFFIQDSCKKSIFVVGDNKQSIYGFQGANPSIFDSFYYILKSHDVENRLTKIEINKSYRSAPIILKFVDRVFSDIDLLPDMKQTVHHDVHNENYTGCVAIHPLFSSADELAIEISSKIKGWLDNNRVVNGREIQPSDIAVLVVHRTAFVTQLKSELHRLNIEVNFIGKIRINDNEILKLLIAIGNFFIYKYDEISLISILKSLGYDDHFILKAKTASTDINLYDHIKDTEIGKLLESWLSFYGTTFEIYTNILTADVVEKLKKFYGSEFDYYLDIFLDNALNEDSIYKFLDLVGREGATFNVSSGNGNGVTISTVHGSKGLEYPVVFIADSNYVPVYRELFVYNEDQIPFWYTEDDVEYFENLKNNKKRDAYHEYLRLLYVALTRAVNEIYIFGTGEKIKNRSWYEICLNTLKSVGKDIGNCIYIEEIT